MKFYFPARAARQQYFLLKWHVCPKNCPTCHVLRKSLLGGDSEWPPGKNFTKSFKLTLAVVFLTSDLYLLSQMERLGIPKKVLLPPRTPPKSPPHSKILKFHFFQGVVLEVPGVPTPFWGQNRDHQGQVEKVRKIFPPAFITIQLLISLPLKIHIWEHMSH